MNNRIRVMMMLVISPTSRVVNMDTVNSTAVNCKRKNNGGAQKTSGET